MSDQPTLEPKKIDISMPVGPRELLYQQSYVRNFVTGSCGTGGSAKTTITDAELVSMAIGRDLLNGRKPLQCGALQVLQLSLEEDQNELHRRRKALAQHYRLNLDELNLLEMNLVCIFGTKKLSIVNSGGNVAEINDRLLTDLNTIIEGHRVDVLTIDPLVSFHEVDENSNSAMQLVLEALRSLARRNNIAISFVHHTRKGSQKSGADDIRGAVALRDGVRNLRVFSKLSSKDAENLSIPSDQADFIVQETNGKSNLQATLTAGKFFKLESVDLENGTSKFPSDQIAVATRYDQPDLFHEIPFNACESVWSEILRLPLEKRRANQQSLEWVGHIIAKKLKIDKHRAKQILQKWEKSGLFTSEKVTIRGSNKPVPCLTISENKLNTLLQSKKLF